MGLAQVPIIVPARAGSELQQGDILKGRLTYFTGSTEDEPPSAKKKKPDFLLVLSRDCSAIRDDIVSVLPVVEYKLSKAEDDFEHLRRVLEVDRDGGRTPDLLYLGPIGETRYAARLSTPFAIEVPLGADRQSWVDAQRVARLERDFVEHLHSRIFTAFARKGFDDQGWLPKEDLDVLVRRGKSDILALEAEVAKNEADQDNAGFRDAKRDKKKLAEALPAAVKRLAELRLKVVPFEKEQRTRREASNDSSG